MLSFNGMMCANMNVYEHARYNGCKVYELVTPGGVTRANLCNVVATTNGNSAVRQYIVHDLRTTCLCPPYQNTTSAR